MAVNHILPQRCLTDINNSKRLTRCYDQIEIMRKTTDLIETKHVPVLLDFIFYTGSKPLWRSELHMANQFKKNGSTKTAIDIYEKYELYDDLIESYQSIGWLKKVI